MSLQYKKMPNPNQISFSNESYLHYDDTNQNATIIGQQQQHQQPPEQSYFSLEPNLEEQRVVDQQSCDHNNSVSFALDEIGAILNSREFDNFARVSKPTRSTSNGESHTNHSQDKATPMQHLREQNNDRYHLPGNYAVQLDQFANQHENIKCNNLLINNNIGEFTHQQHHHHLQGDNFQQQYNGDHQQQQNNYQHLLIKQENTSPFEDYYQAQEESDCIMSNNNNRHNNQPLTLTKNPLAYGAYDKKSRPYVEIVEQPAKCALRFRYKCEGRSAGSLPGASSCADNKTYPAIRINNYVGQATIVISCVTKEAPYRAHPHNIVGKEGCKKGICTVLVNNEPNMVRGFSSLGIQCVKRKDIEESLSVRESIQVDPFRNGFEHKLNSSLIDLNAVRLCFQVFIEGSTPGRRDVPLTPVVSDPIHDKKAMSDLVITKLSHCSAPATGGREVILLCDRIAKDDIQLHFYEEREGKVVWETYTDISPTDVHKQVAICFKTPKYHDENITQPVMARIQLKRISDGQFSEPRYFQFLPCESDEDIITRKRQKIEWVNVNYYALDNILHQPQQQQHLSAGTSHVNQQPQQSNAQEGCQTISPSLNRHPQPTANTIQPPPRSPRQTSPNNHAASSSVTANNHQIQPQSSRQQQQQDLVVRHEIIDNEGRMVRLVDRPQQHQQDMQQDNNIAQTNRVPLGNSLDGINISELMPDMTSFDLNAADYNLGSGLHILPHLDQKKSSNR